MCRSDGYQLVIFDWDGTLLDSISSIVACTQATMEELGEGQVEESVIRSAIGLGLRETVDRFAPCCSDELYGRIVQVYRRRWFGTYIHQPRLFPGTREVLRELGDGDYLLAVATAKSRRGLNEDLAKTGLIETFQATRTVDEAHSKPHPQMILDILGELGVAASESLMVGDTTHDLQMAHSAGSAAAAVLTGSHDRAELSQASPLVYFDDLRELPAWLAEGSREGQ
jgi:phosphoglycolate phosphatase